MPQTGDAQFYQLYFQAPGVAEAEFEKDPHLTLRANLFGGSGEGITAIRAMNAASGKTPRGAAAACCHPVCRCRCHHGLAKLISKSMPVNFARSGFRGPLNYYRNVDRNWELMAAHEGIKVTIPALYIAGDHDLVVAFPGAAEHIANMKHHVPLLRDIQMLAGCGHWTSKSAPQRSAPRSSNFCGPFPTAA